MARPAPQPRPPPPAPPPRPIDFEQLLAASQFAVEQYVAGLLEGIPDIAPGSAGQSLPTASVIFKGNQSAGTPKSFVLPFHGTLFGALCSGSGIMLLRSPLAWTSLPASSWTFSNAVIAMMGGTATATQRVAGLNVDFPQQSTLWLDSLGGLGTSDWCVAFFYVVT